MDSIPHRDHEMVVDEETFMGSSYAIDPYLLSLSPQPDSTSLASSPTPTSISTPTGTTAHSFPITDFYTYRHAGCLCKVKPENFPNVSLQLWTPPLTTNPSPDSTSTTSSTTILWVIFPLHCKMCTWAESQRLKYSTKARCLTITTSTISHELKDRLQAYEKGVRDGRKEALTLPLQWSEFNGSQEGGGMARDMAKMMKALDLGLEGVDETDELAGKLEMVSLEYDALTFDLMHLFDLRDLREKGRVDGLGIQARFEIKRLSKRRY